MWQVHPCGMHAFMPFGKDMLQYSRDFVKFIKALTGVDPSEAGNAWLKQHHINVDISYL